MWLLIFGVLISVCHEVELVFIILLTIIIYSKYYLCQKKIVKYKENGIFNWTCGLVYLKLQVKTSSGNVNILVSTLIVE